MAGGLEQAAGAESAGWQMPADPERLRARFTAEKLIAEEKNREQGKTKGLFGETDGVLRTLGDLFSHLLDS